MDVCQEEIEFKWLDAAKKYEQDLEAQPQSGFMAAESWQRIGKCYDYASRQVNNIEEFKSLRRFGVQAYKRAADFYNESKKKEDKGNSEYCLALAEYLGSWLAADSKEKIESLNKSIEFGKSASSAFKANGNDLGYGKSANFLSQVLYERMSVASTAKEKNAISREGLAVSDEAISVFSKLASKDDLLLAYSLASIQYWYASNIEEEKEARDEFTNKALSYADSAIELGDSIEDPYLFAMSRWAGVYSYLYFKDDIKISMKFAEQMRDKASDIQDNFLIGMAYFLLAYAEYLGTECEDDPNERKNVTESVIKDSEKSIEHLNLVFHDSFVAECYEFVAQTYCELASDYASNRSEKIVYANRALNSGKKGLEHAVRSGTPESMLTVLHGLSKVSYYRSNLETRKNQKVDLLKDALDYRRQHIETAKGTFPSNSWMQGVSEAYAGQIQRDLAGLEGEERNKFDILKNAIADLDDGITKCNNWIVSYDVPSVVGVVARFEDSLGGVLVEDYSLTNEREKLDRANEVYNDAAEKYKQVDFPSRVAESYWKIAKNLDGVSSFDLAAKNFENAYAAYKVAATKIKEFGDFYVDYANYMKAWGEISFAKCAHSSENYEIAMKQYEKASQLLRESKSWMYLSMNFYAWSILEQAENYSRKEKSKKAIKAFEKASKYLQESKRLLEMKLEEMKNADEKDVINRLFVATGARMEYCRGRISVEEAKVLDRQGEHLKSAQEYDNAASIFQELSLSDAGQIKMDAKPLSYLCQAWGKMIMAEAKASPIMYEEAADLFMLAKDYSLKESSGLMAMGHSSYCKALEAGTEFELTRSTTMYEETIRYLEAAAGSYLKSGFVSASDYTRAIQRLFDAYYLMMSAKRERESKKQLEYYSKAEKVLENAADFFEKAKFLSKSSEARNLLNKVREDREFALSLTDIFHAPEVTSSAASFSTLSSVEESAAGIERFDKADIQVKLVQKSTAISVGEEVELKLQMINVGKEAVSLIGIEDLVSADVQLDGKPSYCVIEDEKVVCRGKSLKPLKMEEIVVTFKSFKKGTLQVKPRLVCLDYTGDEVFFEPDPVMYDVAGAVLAGRVPTGYGDLDNLLFGGIPENYSIVLTASSTEEREQLVRRFLEFGAKNGQVTFFISSSVENVEDLVEKCQSNCKMLLCNIRADVMIKDSPNVYKIGGVSRITDIEIALIRAFRSVPKTIEGPKRICISIVSDVLLEQHAVQTRKWLGGLLADLKSKGFTVLVVVDPDMHPKQEVQAILSLFDGEIRITEKETEKGIEQRLRIRKLYHQQYLENEIVLTREKLNAN